MSWSDDQAVMIGCIHLMYTVICLLKSLCSCDSLDKRVVFGTPNNYRRPPIQQYTRTVLINMTKCIFISLREKTLDCYDCCIVKWAVYYRNQHKNFDEKVQYCVTRQWCDLLPSHLQCTDFMCLNLYAFF